MGGAVFPPCCLTWGQTVVEVMKIMGTSYKRSHACTAALNALNPAAGHRQPTPTPETPGHSRTCLGQFLVESLLLSPRSCCSEGSVCALQESVSPVLCKFWWFSDGVNGNLLQEGVRHTQVCCTRSPCPCSRPLLTRTSTGDAQTQFWLSLLWVGHLVSFPGLNSSGDQVLGECTVPGELCILIICLVPATPFPRCALRALSQVCCVCPLESWSQSATFLVGVNHPGSQEDVVSSWQPAHSLVENAVSGAEIAVAPCLLALAASLPPIG